jgi:hypothetical protein
MSLADVVEILARLRAAVETGVAGGSPCDLLWSSAEHKARFPPSFSFNSDSRFHSFNLLLLTRSQEAAVRLRDPADGARLSWLVDEVSAHVHSRDYGGVLTIMLDAVFDAFIDALRPVFGEPSGAPDSVGAAAAASVGVPLAKLLAHVAKQGRAVATAAAPALQRALAQPVVGAFSAAVYAAIGK